MTGKARTLRLACALITALFCASAFADGLDEVVTALQKRYEAISTVEAEFTQEVYSRSFKTTRKSSGVVEFKKPGRMRWEYKTPEADLIVSDGKKIWVFQPDLNQVIEKDASVAASIATDFLSGIGSLKKEFSIRLAKKGEETYTLDLTPRQAQPNVKSVSLEVDRSTFLVVRTNVVDHFGNETRVAFKGIKTNTEIKDRAFELKLPEGARIVRP